MVARGPGAVGCAHCTQLGAEQPCAGCGHLVCAACARDWSSCAEPAGRAVQLPERAAMVDADPSGRVALVELAAGRLRAFDLRTLRWTGPELPMMPGATSVPPRLTSDRRVIRPEQRRARTGMEHAGLRLRALDASRTSLLAELPAPTGTGETTAELYYYPVGDSLVLLGLVEHAPLANARLVAGTAKPQLAWTQLRSEGAIERAYVDAAAASVAIADAAAVTVRSLPAMQAVRRFEVRGATRLALEGNRLAMVFDNDVEVWRLDGYDSMLMIPHTGECALSRDGRYLATDRGVWDLDGGAVVPFEAGVTFVRFVGDDQVLVTGDRRGSVAIRPRGADGYGGALVLGELS